MRTLHLIVIASIFGAVIVFVALIIFTSPLLVPAPGVETGSGSVKYGPVTPLPGPRYYTGIDFDSLQSDDHLPVLPLKSYRQQVTNYSCGAVAAMTVLSYYGMPVNNTDADEERVAHEMYSNISEKTGVNPEQVAAWLTRQGMNATWGTNGSRAMLRENLMKGIPPMVEWMDWGATGLLSWDMIHGARRTPGMTSSSLPIRLTAMMTVLMESRNSTMANSMLCGLMPIFPGGYA